MPKSENQKLKLLYLARILLRETDQAHPLGMSQLISRLGEYGVSAERKSIYSDIDALRTFGLDIECQKGANCGYYVASRDFELPELKLLVDAVQSSKFITQKKSAELIRKLEALTGKYEAQQLARQVYITNRLKTINEKIYYTVDSLHQAINENSLIAFRYYEWNSDKQKVFRRDGEVYRVSPWALCWDDENYYLIGTDMKDGVIKHFRVDKLEGLRLLGEKRPDSESLQNLDTALYAKKVFSMFGGREETVTLRCKNSRAGVIIDRFGEDVVFRRADSGHFEVTVKVAVSPHFLSWLISFAGEITVLSPDSVRRELRELAKKALESMPE